MEAADSSDALPTDRRPVFNFHRPVPRWAGIVLACLVWACFFAGWQAVVSLSGISDLILPEPSAVLRALYDLFAHQHYLHDVAVSVGRVVVSFAAASAIAVPAGVMMGSFRPVESFFNPFVSAARYLPATAFVPLLLMWFGAGDFQKIALLFLGVVWFLITMVMDYTKGVSADLVETSLTLGGSRLQILLTVQVPAALPQIWTAMRQMLAASWTYLVVAEIVAATDGVGAMMTRAARFVHTDQVMAGIFTIGALGLMFDQLFKLLGALMFPHAEPRTK